MKIRVPATSANLGCGFDSCGIALSLYLTLDTGVPAESWYIAHEIEDIPHDETNLIIQTALSLVPNMEPRRMSIQTEIPAARGLGSSSSAIVAGIELASRIGELGLTRQRKLEIATALEGHPDNVAPAIYGEFVVACYFDDEVESVKHHFPDCDVVVFIPEYELLTTAARDVLPKEISFSEGVKGSAISNVMIGAVINGNLSLAGKMMEKDIWHEKYRGPLIPQLAPIRELARQLGCYGTVLSGAGPSILTICPPETTAQLVKEIEALNLPGRVDVLDIDRDGVQVY